MKLHLQALISIALSEYSKTVNFFKKTKMTIRRNSKHMNNQNIGEDQRLNTTMLEALQGNLKVRKPKTRCPQTKSL